LVSIYFVLDPFKVIKDYESFYEPLNKDYVVLNKDFVSTSTYIKNKDLLNYDSFIFGSSASIFYEIIEWKKHLNADASCFHFDASDESLFGIDKKIELITQKGNVMKNVLLILDARNLVQDKPNPNSHLFMISPELVDYSNFINFHSSFIKIFCLNPLFLVTYINYKTNGKLMPNMSMTRFLDNRIMNYDKKTNEMRFEYFENLAKNGKYYNPTRLSWFNNRDTIFQKYSDKVILKNQKIILNNILSNLEKNNTNYKLIINPKYDQIKINQKDIEYLKTIFGKENVFDFSGINEITNNYENYYDVGHYRPKVAKEIIEKIYSD